MPRTATPSQLPEPRSLQRRIALALATLWSLVALAGCPRQEYALGDDWRDAGGVRDAGSPVDAGSGTDPKCSRADPACKDGQFCNIPASTQCGADGSSGTCTEPPSSCVELKSPVCGCDGVTYDSACAAATARVSVDYSKVCDIVVTLINECGATTGKTCIGGQYCNYPPEAACGAKQSGSCVAIGSGGCAKSGDPVCGCDGISYANACSAEAAGVSVARSGECAAADGGMPQSCGSRGLAGCPADSYCRYERDANCGDADASGECAAKPAVCDDDYTPVCGCDDKTYSNACNAAAAGVSVRMSGECAGVQACGGLTAQTCPSGQYCNYALDAICGAADASGVCNPIPSACTRELNQVCACDDKTYDNPCLAATAGTSVRAQGACDPPQGVSCGGLRGASCPSGQYCNFPLNAQCGAADQPGSCASVPQFCTQQSDPVCGCDDKTYGNPCAAASAGVSVRSAGGC